MIESKFKMLGDESKFKMLGDELLQRKYNPQGMGS